MNRRAFLKSIGLSMAAAPLATAAARRPLNILLFTADDLNCDSLGCFGSQVPGISPNLDRFAAQSTQFSRGHVNVAICQPSRGVLGTGRYSHNSGIMGFMHTDRDIPTIMQTMRGAGYLTGILGKVNHSTPHEDYEWDFAHDAKELGGGRSPKKYHQYCKEFFQRCQDENKPFYFMVNSHDPHRPYHIPGGKPSKNEQGAEAPSRIYSPEEITVPGFVPDLPGVRQELSYYFNSVRRCDDTFGKVMQALHESGFEGDTMVTFLSDNGIAIPFAKCNAYLASTNTPWMVRYPGVARAGAKDTTHFISGIDFFPTVLDAAGLPPAEGVDGRSYLPLLRGETQSGRDRVFTQIDRKAGGGATPMRCVQNARFGYIYNAWSDGENYWYRNNNEGLTMKAMEASDDPEAAKRVHMFRYRVVEEFYDLEKDPACLNNLVDNPEYQTQVKELRAQLEQQMRHSNDPLIEAYQQRNDPDAMRAAFHRLYPNPLGTKKRMN